MSTDLTLPEKPSGELGYSTASGFELSQRIGKMFSSSQMIPKNFQGRLPDCIIAINMAARMGADPLMVMQNLYVVHGTPAWSSKFMVACFNHTGRFSSLRYEFVGKQIQDDWGCRAVSTELSTGEKLVGPLVTLRMAKNEGWTKNSTKWSNMPELMLRYRAAAFFIRVYAPEITMGLMTAEEVEDVGEKKQASGVTVSQPTLESLLDAEEPTASTSEPLMVEDADFEPVATYEELCRQIDAATSLEGLGTVREVIRQNLLHIDTTKCDELQRKYEAKKQLLTSK